MILFENTNKDCEKWNKKHKLFTELLLKIGFLQCCIIQQNSETLFGGCKHNVW